jgi:hypothetical protein
MSGKRIFVIGLGLAVLTGSTTMANRVVNGDFELWDDPPTIPTDWGQSGANLISSQVTGLDGTGYAVQVATAGGAAGGLFQTLPPEDKVTGSFFISMDFAFDTPVGGDRVLNPSIRDGTSTIRLNIWTAIDPGNPTGPQDLQFHDGSTWHTVAADLSPSDFAAGSVHPYRMEMTGDTTTEALFVTVTDLTTGIPVVANYDATALWSANPAATGGGINHFRFDTQRIDAPYRIDNVVLTPEPVSLLLLMLGGAALAGTRRRHA